MPKKTLLKVFAVLAVLAIGFASAADMKVSDMSANSPVGTTLAIFERTLKVMTKRTKIQTRPAKRL